MTDEYELPRTEDGDVDLYRVALGIEAELYVSGTPMFCRDRIYAILKAIDANARADTKEDCGNIAGAFARGYGINHCDNCRDGETSSSNIAAAIKKIGVPQ